MFPPFLFAIGKTAGAIDEKRDALAKLAPGTAIAAKAKVLAELQQVCNQSMQGFEATYRLTFYASIGALLLSFLLPGWPAKWSGRASMQGPVAGGH